MSTAPTPNAPRRRPKSHLIVTVAALILAGVLLYFSLRGIDWAKVYALLRHADPMRVGVTCVLFTTSLFLRAYRWRVLLLSQGHVSIPTAFWATAAGYFGNNFLPARAGEVARTLMISAQSGMSRTCVLTMAMLERIADAIALVVISALVLLVIPDPPAWLARTAKPFGIAGLCSVLVIALLPRLERWGTLMLQRMPVPAGFRDKLIAMLGQILEGMRSFHDARRLIAFVGLTVVIWTIDAAGTVIGGSSLGLTIPFPVAFLLIAGLGLGSALPSTPGYVGIYQFVAVSVLTPFGFSKTDAIAYILLAQAISYLLVGFWGTIGLMRYRRSGGRLHTEAAQS